ncbi:Short-chain dehydrogenase [Haloechinothrix alba]|uniref:Short-chain dehydrogenase n=1 Tax=Haloechinothrix alba TaxID=664784 RepID=A0A238YAP2_9PSEU|nr:SDR family oxidoreductase [Haloechinothrix alba]SNR68336.1 Short-chain dehydrogenase [Haloechinothrix alba]
MSTAEPGRTEVSWIVESAGARLAVYEHGDPGNETVLLVHGYPDTHSVWDGVAALLAESFHVVTYDVRGAGRSSAPRASRDYRLDLLAADLFAVADAVCPDEPVHVVAHDWGSIQSWEAVTDPGAERRIASFTSISGPCLDHVGHQVRQRLSRPTPRNLGKLVSQLLHSWYILLFQLPLLAPAVWRLWLARRWASVLERVEGVPPTAGHPAPTLRSDAVRGIALYRANMLGRVGRGPRERSTGIPVQLIQPSGDHYVTEALTEGVERWAPRLWRRTVQAGHWVPLTHPEAVARMATEFIRHIGGEPASRTVRRARVGVRRAPFADHLVVVTGAGSGIGRETALTFAEAGAEVVASDIDKGAARRTAELVEVLGSRGYGYGLDVTDESAVRDFAGEVAARHGVPDIVVNNAGIGHGGPFMATTTKDWHRVLDVNLWGVIHGCRAFGERMVERAEGGYIVNVASMAAYLPTRDLPAYATSKAAVYMLSDCLRAELDGHAIGVSTICPGVVSTNITRTATFAGVGEAEQGRKRDRATGLYARRNYTPRRVAAEIVRAVQRGKPIVPVTPEAKVTYLLSRVSPATLRAAAKLEVS